MILLAAALFFSCRKESINPSVDCSKGVSSTQTWIIADWGVTNNGTMSFQKNGIIGSYTYSISDCGKNIDISDGTTMILSTLHRDVMQIQVIRNGVANHETMTRIY